MYIYIVLQYRSRGILFETNIIQNIIFNAISHCAILGWLSLTPKTHLINIPRSYPSQFERKLRLMINGFLPSSATPTGSVNEHQQDL